MGGIDVSRLVWVGVGAVGGIYVYRRGHRVWQDAKDRGVAGNLTILTTAASAMLAKDGRAAADGPGARP